MTDLLTDRDPNDSGEIPRITALTEPTAAMERIAPPYTDGSPVLRLYCTSEQPLYAPPVPKPPTLPKPPPPKPSFAGHQPIEFADDDTFEPVETYVGRHRAPDDMPMPGTWKTGLASAVRAGWARVKEAF